MGGDTGGLGGVGDAVKRGTNGAIQCGKGVIGRSILRLTHIVNKRNKVVLFRGLLGRVLLGNRVRTTTTPFKRAITYWVRRRLGRGCTRGHGHVFSGVFVVVRGRNTICGVF